MLEYVAEQEKENTSFVPILPYEYMIYAPGYTELLDVIRIKEQEEIPRAENILENEQIRNSVLILNEFYKNGYLSWKAGIKVEICKNRRTLYNLSNRRNEQCNSKWE